VISSTFSDRNVSIFGLGYVGLTLAVAMANKGFRVHGVEVRQDILAQLALGKSHFHEPGLDSRLAKVLADGSLTYSEEVLDRISATVFIITVGTPLNEDGLARLDMVTNATKDVGTIMPEGALIILRSTVKLGTARNVVIPVLQATGKRFEIACCPERTLEGRALAELSQLPQIIGSDDPATLRRAAQLFGSLTPTTVRVDGLETAEMIKLVDNTFRDVSFGFANEIARACDAVGLSAAEVIRAGKLGYPRTNLPMPGPVGGPCLAKDPHILLESLSEWNAKLPITAAARATNENQPTEIAEFLANQLGHRLGGRPAVIALLGLAFKGQPATDDLRGTMARPILSALQDRFPNAAWRGYDPVVQPRDIESLGLLPCASIADAVDGANAVLILNNHPAFQAMPIENLADLLAEPGLFYDCWNLFTDEVLQFPPQRAYFALGSHKRGQFSSWN